MPYFFFLKCSLENCALHMTHYSLPSLPSVVPALEVLYLPLILGPKIVGKETFGDFRKCPD